MADPADSADFAAPGRSPVTHDASSAPSASSVSVETENKLARAVQSAQRLAQLSEVPRDDGAPDLFPDDPTRALVPSTTIDSRQGTLSGFELPQVVHVVVDAAQDANAMSAPAVPRRAARSKATAAAGADDTAMVDTNADAAAKRGGAAANALEATGDAGVAEDGGAGAVEAGGWIADVGGWITDVGVPVEERVEPVLHADAPTAAAANADAPVLPGRAAAEVHATHAWFVHGNAATDAVAPAGDGAVAPGSAASIQHNAADVPPVDGADPSTVSAPDSEADGASTLHGMANGLHPSVMVEGVEAATGRHAPPTVDNESHDGEPAAPPALRAARTPATSPELDQARAIAFADTVDALYGVIADQRRAAADLRRRMKWMLAIVLGALLVTAGVGIAQTLLLSRLARDAAAQQQRIGQMLQTGQTVLASMPERVAAPAPAASTPAAPPAAVHPAAPAPTARASAVHAPAMHAPAVHHRSPGHHPHSPGAQKPKRVKERSLPTRSPDTLY